MADKKTGGGEGLTPYQGNKSGMGHFKCPNEGKEWVSAYSWADTSQKCNDCKTDVYPYKQYPKEPDGGKRGDDQHMQDLCQRCDELGKSCTDEKKKK